MSKYKSFEDSAKSITVSMNLNTISILDVHAVSLDTDRSKLIVALIKYLNDNSKKILSEVSKYLNVD